MVKEMGAGAANMIAGLVALLAILFGFWLLNDIARSLFWLLFVIISYPIILAIFIRPDSIGSGIFGACIGMG